MSNKIIKSIKLFFQEQPSDKVYNASLLKTSKGYSVSVEWGRRGTRLSTTAKVVDASLDKAQEVYDKVVKKKMGKGYEELTADNKPAKVAPVQGEGSASRPGVAVRARIGSGAQLLNYAKEKDIDRLLADPKIVAQQKFDGMRMIIHVREAGVLATNREGQETLLPKVIGEASRVAPVGTVFDGELLSRPHTYWVFDLLAWADEDVRNQPYIDRYARLRRQKKLFANKKIVLVPSAKTATAKRKLYRVLQKQKAEGIVFKRGDAPYTSGRPASGGSQLKHKFVKTAEVFISNNINNAYQMAMFDDNGKPQEVGKVFSGTTSKLRKTLDTMLSEKETPIVEVRYLYATKNSNLFQPVFVRLRTDKSAGDCVLSQLVYTDRTRVARA